MTMPVRLAAAAAIGALVLGGALLLAGGGSRQSLAVPTATASPATLPPVWTTAAPMVDARTDFAAVLLPDGRVLAVGGRSPGRIIATAEIFDPATGTWSSAGKMSQARNFPTATLLSTGKVLVLGGTDATSPAGTVVDLYDPATNTWTKTGETKQPRGQHAAVLLADGKVLVVGGDRHSAVPPVPTIPSRACGPPRGP